MTDKDIKTKNDKTRKTKNKLDARKTDQWKG